MSKKIYFVILIILVLIFSYLSFWHFKKFSQILPEVKLPEIKMPEIKLEEFLPLEKEGYKEWNYQDGKLKLKYQTNWLESSEVLLEQVEQKGLALPGAKILFFASKFYFKNQALAFLMIEEIVSEKTLDEIIENMKKNFKERGEEMEIANLEKENNSTYLEIKAGGFQTKMKIIFDEEKTYLISFSSPEKDWLKLKEERDEIFGSIEFAP